MARQTGIKTRKLREAKWKTIRRNGKLFKGVLVTSENYSDFTSEERNFHKKHLKAFLKGYRKFNYGFDLLEAGQGIHIKIPKTHTVESETVTFWGTPI